MIQSYFDSEKKAGFVSLAIGLVACSLGSAFFISAMPPFYTGLAVSFVVIGIMEIWIGSSMSRKSDFQALDMEKLQTYDPAGFVELELPRMEKEMRWYMWMSSVGGILLVIGILLTAWNRGETFLSGLACSLLIQSIVVQVFATLGKRRSRQYIEYVKGISTKKN